MIHLLCGNEKISLYFFSREYFRPFVGYNFGHYIQHWLDFEKNPKNRVKHFFI
jgi:GTP-dependent phosphoenolpyruvate carboxykinase